MFHKKKLVREIYTRRLRLNEDRLKRLNPKLFRLRKSRWTFRKKSLKKYLYIESKFKHEEIFYEEDLRQYLSDEFYFYDLYRFFADMAYGDEIEFGQELHFYTQPTSLYPADEYSYFDESKPEELNEFKNNLTQLVDNLSKQNKHALITKKMGNGEFKFKIIKNKQFSIKRKEKQNEIISQPKIVENKPKDKNVKKEIKEKGKKPLTQIQEQSKNVQQVSSKQPYIKANFASKVEKKNLNPKTKKSEKDFKK